jgi:hypothetical protein
MAFGTGKIFSLQICPCLTLLQLTKIFHTLGDMWVEQLSPAERKKMAYFRVHGTGRTSTTIPSTVPWNAGIDEQWYRENVNNPKYARALQHWMKYPSAFDAFNLEDLGADADDES